MNSDDQHRLMAWLCSEWRDLVSVAMKISMTQSMALVTTRQNRFCTLTRATVIPQDDFRLLLKCEAAGQHLLCLSVLATESTSASFQ